ncbi:MAG: hypothetical protein JWO62_635 [Acidimicrobiaceae bacterium]|jgi:hypothetical protein|nr:hypothetical protein [Acidimicrobiaceae bacterium]
MTEHQPSRRRRAVALTVAVPLLAASAGLGESAAAAATVSHSSTPTTANLVTAAKKAMLAKKSVHFELFSLASGTSEHIVADAGASTGRQVITSGKSTASVLVTTTDAYFDGNASGLSLFFGMPAADITKVGSKWVYVKAGTTQYTSFKNGVVSSSLPASFLPTAAQVKTTTITNGTVANKRVYILKWTTTSSGKKVTETINLDATGTSLPISASGVSGKNHTTTTFSKWGEQIKLTAPTSLIAFTKLAG